MEDFPQIVIEYKNLHPVRFWSGTVLLAFVMVLIYKLLRERRKNDSGGTSITVLESGTASPITTSNGKADQRRSSSDKNSKTSNNQYDTAPKKKTLQSKVKEPTATYKPSVKPPSQFNPHTDVSRPKPKTKEKLPKAKVETKPVQNEPLKVNYSSSKAEQTDLYPIFRCPKKNTVVRSYRIGSTKRRGFKEEVFQESIEKVFGEDFTVSGELRINTGRDTRPFEPDIALIDKKNSRLRIDIEIDEPYAGITRQPTHCQGDDTMRDIYFVDRGWVVIRFSEHQVHKFEKECLRFISETINAVSPTFVTPSALTNSNIVENEKLWNTVQAQKWEKSRFREEYLNHEFIRIAVQQETIERDFNEQEKHEEKLVKPTLIGVADKSASIGFNLLNSHPRDKRIEFYPEPHIYTIDNTPAPSASTIISKFFPEFDIEYWSERKAEELGMTSSEVAEMWKRKGEKAAQEGTHLHEQIEKYYLNQDYDPTEEFHLFEQFVADHSEIKPFRSEWRIFDEENHIAGTIDLISKSGNGFEIYDWKRSKKVVNPITGEPISNNRWQSGVGNLREIDDTSYNRYCLQQSLYRYILEKNYGIRVSNMYLVVLYPSYDKYYKIEVPYQKDKAKYILATL